MSAQTNGVDIAALETVLRSLLQQELSSAGMKPAPEVHLTSEERRCAEMAAMGFTEASELWLSHHQMHLKPGTLRSYRTNLRPLRIFFAQTPLLDLGLKEIRRYQNWRLQKAGAIRTNADVGILQQILRDANLWHPLENLYKPCPVIQKKVRQSLSPEQEASLYRVVLNAPPKRKCAGHCLLIMANTTMGFGELRHLRRRDIVEIDGTLQVHVNEGAKNEMRSRFIPLNAIALKSMQWLLIRWAKLGGTQPDQYLLPHPARRTKEQRQSRGHKRVAPPDFMTPVGHMYRAARGLLKEAGLEGIVPYDMRSHAITKLLSDPDVSPQVSQEIAGHVDERMQRRYSRQQFDTKRKAVDAMCRTFAPAGALRTNAQECSLSGTSHTPAADTLSQMLREMQERFGITTDQLRQALSV